MTVPSLLSKIPTLCMVTTFVLPFGFIKKAYPISCHILGPQDLPPRQYRSIKGLVWLKAQQVHPRINRQGLTGNMVSGFQQPYHHIGY